MNDEASLCFIAHATDDTRSVRAPILRATLMQRSAWRDCLIIPIDPIMDSRKRPQRDQKRRLAAFRAAERGRSWVL